jgi:hypothetical protein
MKSFRKQGYVKRLNKQTLDWLNGNPQHNKVDDECCPDFSCCKPELLAPIEVRQVFFNADLKGDHATTDRLLGEFLGKMIDSIPSKPKVHIAGLDVQRQEVE